MPVSVIKTDFSTKKEDCTVENGKKVILDFTGKLGGVTRGNWITISGLNIRVGEDETLAFGDTDMVVLPEYNNTDTSYLYHYKVFQETPPKTAQKGSIIFKIKGYRLD